MKIIFKELTEYKQLLRKVPSLVVTVFVLSVVIMNLLANKELINTPYLALDCGTLFSWIPFLCMDMVCKHFGPRAASKLSILAIFINLIVVLMFKIVSLTPGMWGEYYTTGSYLVNTSLNNTIGGCYYVVLGSCVAMLVSSLVNTQLNAFIGLHLKNNNFFDFAVRSYTSTIVAQFVDNTIFSTIVSHVFFGWTLNQVLICAITNALFELLCEILISPIGYKITKQWEKEGLPS